MSYHITDLTVRDLVQEAMIYKATKGYLGLNVRWLTHLTAEPLSLMAQLLNLMEHRSRVISDPAESEKCLNLAKQLDVVKALQQGVIDNGMEGPTMQELCDLQESRMALCPLRTQGPE